LSERRKLSDEEFAEMFPPPTAEEIKTRDERLLWSARNVVHALPWTNVSPLARLVLIALVMAVRAKPLDGGDDDAVAEEGIESLGQMLGITEGELLPALAELERTGLITVVYRDVEWDTLFTAVLWPSTAQEIRNV
jgi:hypothetical protein